MKTEGRQRNFLRDFSALQPGDHLCCLYETDEERQAVAIPFIRQGLEQGQKVLYIIEAQTSQRIVQELRQAGVNSADAINQGQLEILSRQDSYVREGGFDPDMMVALLRAETSRAVAKGYTALRVIGEMTWIFQNSPGSGGIIAYEVKLNEFFLQSQCLAIFQYDQRRFEAQSLLEVLRTHPITVIGTEVYDNVYYIPPQELLEKNLAETELSCRLKFLSDHKQAEQVRSREFQALEEFGTSQKSAITSEIFQIEPLHKSAPALFDRLVMDYEQVLELALKEQLYKIDHKVSERLEHIAEQLGFTRAGPRDVVNLHIAALKRKVREQTALKAQAYNDAGRITLLQLMGYLASYYRNYYSGSLRAYRSTEPLLKREDTRE